MKTFDGCEFFQGYAENANDFYKSDGLNGHPGIDAGCGYGTPILFPVSGRVCGVYTPEKPANDGYVAVYVIVQTALEIFEFNVGHCSKVFVKVGDMVKKGDTVALEGNRGVVYAGNLRITLAMQAAGDKRGAHRHWQKRVVKEVKKRSSSKRYLQNWNGYVKSPAGNYYEWALPDNGMVSCVDFLKPLWNRNLDIGISGYDVTLLQRVLGVEETGWYGTITQTALDGYQLRHGLAQGPCGPKTRAFLNSHYGQLEDPVVAVAEPSKELVASLVKASEEVAAMPPEQKTGFLAIFTSILKNLGLIP